MKILSHQKNFLEYFPERGKPIGDIWEHSLASKLLRKMDIVVMIRDVTTQYKDMNIT